jgi:uncharacterized protein YbaA (DUF1428 family)
MAYIDGFVAAVPTANKDKFLDHAKTIDALFFEFGAHRVVECWSDDVAHGKVTDFYRAVQATEDESIVFSWIEWPDKATRDAGMVKMMTDDRMNGPMPFDGKRMVYGGFAPVFDARGSGSTGYVDGFLIPVKLADRDAYVALAEKAGASFMEYGAIRSAENWGDDVTDGKVTDFKRAVHATGDEAVLFSWVEWLDKTARDAGWAKMMAVPELQPETVPFDGKRMIYGGFDPIFIQEA